LAAVPTIAFAHHSAHEVMLPSSEAADSGAEVVLVDRGEDLAIQCDGIKTPGAEVRVVMSLDPIVGETPTGFDAVLLTNEEVVGSKTVRVRVPDIADLVNHTVTLRVYVTAPSGTTACNAGHMRIAQL
jgi:hypothetical protein